MRQAGCWALGAALLMSTATLAFADGVPAQAGKTAEPVRNPDPDPPPPPPPPMRTIAQGLHSGWGLDHPEFAGGDFLIPRPEAWEAFWQVHSEGTQPPPPVDFRGEVVLVSVQGPQPTTGGPNISIAEILHEGPFNAVIIVDDQRPGPAPEPSNPFHIVAVRRDVLPPMRGLTFQHVRPMPDSGVVAGHVATETPDGDIRPVPGAHVMLVRPNEAPRHTASAFDGSFSFVNVPAGQYLLRVERDGFEPQETLVDVAPNAFVVHDFLLERIPVPTGAVGGFVLAENPNGDPLPLPGAHLILIRNGAEVDHRITGDAGGFLFDEVPVGEYLLVAEAPGFEPQDIPVVVEENQLVEHVFVLSPAPPPPPGAFVGRVLGVTPNNHPTPLAGAWVRLLSPDGVVGEAQTNNRGVFRIFDVPPGDYLARAGKEGWQPQEMPVEIVPGVPTHRVFHLMPEP